MPHTFDLKARHNARKHIVQALYQWQMAQASISEIEQQFLDDFLGTRVERPYFQSLLYEIPQRLQEIDAGFSAYLSRAQSEIDPIELAVLRLASYELLFRIDIPYQVIINEALQLTKTFGTQEGFRFVNGVLDKAAQTIRKEEYMSQAKNP